MNGRFIKTGFNKMKQVKSSTWIKRIISVTMVLVLTLASVGIADGLSVRRVLAEDMPVTFYGGDSTNESKSVIAPDGLLTFPEFDANDFPSLELTADRKFIGWREMGGTESRIYLPGNQVSVVGADTGTRYMAYCPSIQELFPDFSRDLSAEISIDEKSTYSNSDIYECVFYKGDEPLSEQGTSGEMVSYTIQAPENTGNGFTREDLINDGVTVTYSMEMLPDRIEISDYQTGAIIYGEISGWNTSDPEGGESVYISADDIQEGSRMTFAGSDIPVSGSMLFKANIGKVVTRAYLTDYTAEGNDPTSKMVEAEGAGLESVPYTLPALPAREGFIGCGYHYEQIQTENDNTNILENAVYNPGDSIDVVSDWVQERERILCELSGCYVREDAMNMAYKFTNGEEVINTQTANLIEYTVNSGEAYENDQEYEIPAGGVCKFAPVEVPSTEITSDDINMEFVGWRSSLDDKVYEPGSKIPAYSISLAEYKASSKEISLTPEFKEKEEEPVEEPVEEPEEEPEEVKPVEPQENNVVETPVSPTESAQNPENNLITCLVRIISEGSIGTLTYNFTQTNENESNYEVTLPINDPLREGYYFKGWQDSRDNNIYGRGEKVSLRYSWGNIDFRAIWVALMKRGSMRLDSGTEYRFGDGSWSVNGDTTVYNGNQSFYVSEAGDYTIE